MIVGSCVPGYSARILHGGFQGNGFDPKSTDSLAPCAMHAFGFSQPMCSLPMAGIQVPIWQILNREPPQSGPINLNLIGSLSGFLEVGDGEDGDHQYPEPLPEHARSRQRLAFRGDEGCEARGHDGEGGDVRVWRPPRPKRNTYLTPRP